MKKNYPQEHRKASNKNFKEIAGYMIACQKRETRIQKVIIKFLKSCKKRDQ